MFRIKGLLFKKRPFRFLKIYLPKKGTFFAGDKNVENQQIVKKQCNFNYFIDLLLKNGFFYGILKI